MGRTKSGSLPSYRQHKSTGQAVVTVNGVDVYLGKYGTPKSKAEYARVIARFSTTGTIERTLTLDEDEPICVVEVLNAYWKHASKYYLKDGQATDEQRAVKKVTRDLCALCGDLPAREFGPKMLKTVRQNWIAQGLSRGYINQNTGRVRRIFKWAVAEELVSAAMLEGLRAVTGLRKGRSEAIEPRRVLPVALEVVERTLPHLSSVVADMVRFQLLTGARPGEVCALRPDSIDRTRDVWEYVVSGHKMEHHDTERTIYVGPEAQVVIAPYLRRGGNVHCFSPIESVADLRARRSAKRKTPLSCGNRPGKKFDRGGIRGKSGERRPKTAFTTGSYGQAIKRACDLAFPPPAPISKNDGETQLEHLARLTVSQKAALKEWRISHRWAPNQLRHTRGTEVRKRFGLEAAQVILGHAGADVTQIYAERDAEKAREVARAIG